MGFLTTLFGGNGAQFQAQDGQNLQQGFTSDQAAQAAQGTQNALAQQPNLAPQAGLTNALGQQGNLTNQLAGQNGIGNQSQVYNQLQGVASGTGPNPAQAMLAQATGQNVANQGALAAGQRGAGANVGLLERGAAQQGANVQQQAAGQAATLQAQQSLGALGQAGNIAGQQVTNQIGATGANTQANLQNQGLSNQSALQEQQINNQSALQNQQLINQALQAQNTMNVQNAQQQNASNSVIANTNAQAQNAFVNNLLGGSLNSAGGSLATNIGGAMVGAAHGGYIDNPKLAAVSPEDRYGGPKYEGNKFGDVGKMPKYAQGGLTLPPDYQVMANIYHDAPAAKPMAYGGMASDGGQVPGQAKMSGDHLSNDTVKAQLSPGEVVIPKSIVEGKDPVKGAAQFMASVLRKEGKENQEGEFKQALKRAVKNRKVKS